MVEKSTAPAFGEDWQTWRAMDKVEEDMSATNLKGLFPSVIRIRVAPLSIAHELTRMANVDNSQNYPRHELLGSRVVQSDDTEPSWQNDLDVKEVLWLSEHVLLDEIVFPPAGYMAMAGESMQQLLDGDLEFYTMEDFTITSPLVLSPYQQVELLTTLRPVTAAGNTSQWYEINITSYDGSDWVERCVSKVSASSASISEDLNVSDAKDAFPRNIAPGYWYDVVANIGIKYGPGFQGLDKISTSLTEPKAVATLYPLTDTTKYNLHPVTIDQCLQILMIAATKGQGRELNELSVITTIKHIVITSGIWSTLKVEGTAVKNEAGGLAGDVSVVSEDGHPILSIKACKTAVVPNVKPKDDKKLFSFVDWHVDATFRNLNRVLAPFHSELDPSILLEKLALVHTLNMRDSEGAPAQSYLQRIYHAVTVKTDGRFGIINDISQFTGLDIATRGTIIRLLKAQISGTNLACMGTLVEQLLTMVTPSTQCSVNTKKKMLEQSHPLLRHNGIIADNLKHIAHKNPKLRVLELGNGSDEATRRILSALESEFGEHMYLNYTYATTSPEAVNGTRNTFKDSGLVKVISFDVNKPLKEQGLQAGGYDLIITTDVCLPSDSIPALTIN
jgi:acyl transferase domain-containing protein